MTIEKRRRKWLEFMDIGSSSRSIVLINYSDPDLGQRLWPYPQHKKARLDWAVMSYEHQLERMLWLDDDRVPYLSPYTGTEIFAQAFGCKVHYSGDNMPFALPLISDAKDISKIKRPRLHDTPLTDLFEMAEQMRQRVGHDAIIQLPDIQSPTDIAALILEKSQFLVTMVDDPMAIKTMIEMTESLLTEFLDQWFTRFGRGYIAHFPNYYMEGGFTFSEDEVGIISPVMFEQFCLEPINRLSRRYGGCGMHCCADAMHQWTGFKKIDNLKLINFVQPSSVLQKAGLVFGDSVCHWHYDGSGHDQDREDTALAQWIDHCPDTAHVVIEAAADTKHEAIELCAKLRESRPDFI